MKSEGISHESPVLLKSGRKVQLNSITLKALRGDHGMEKERTAYREKLHCTMSKGARLYDWELMWWSIIKIVGLRSGGSPHSFMEQLYPRLFFFVTKQLFSRVKSRITFGIFPLAVNCFGTFHIKIFLISCVLISLPSDCLTSSLPLMWEIIKHYCSLPRYVGIIVWQLRR